MKSSIVSLRPLRHIQTPLTIELPGGIVPRFSTDRIPLDQVCQLRFTYFAGLEGLRLRPVFLG